MTTSLTLVPLREIALRPTDSAQARFEAFHRANPQVLDAIIAIARGLREAGLNRASIWLVYNRLRWIFAIQTQGDEYRLNNNYTGYYARVVMAYAPDLSGFFTTRRLSEPYQIDWAALGLVRP